MRAAAAAIGWQIEVLIARSPPEIDAAFARLAQIKADALLVSQTQLFDVRRAQVLTLAARYAVPTMFVPARMLSPAG